MALTNAQKNQIGLAFVGQLQRRAQVEKRPIQWTDLTQDQQLILLSVPIGGEVSPGTWLRWLLENGVVAGGGSYGEMDGSCTSSEIPKENDFWNDFTYWGTYGEVRL